MRHSDGIIGVANATEVARRGSRQRQRTALPLREGNQILNGYWLAVAPLLFFDSVAYGAGNKNMQLLSIDFTG
jgi:hypothetical protein